MTRFGGPVAGGPWHGKEMVAENPLINCPLLSPGQYLTARPMAPEIGGIPYEEYRWHARLGMWIWAGPDVPIRP